jgi:hypothetical protein
VNPIIQSPCRGLPEPATSTSGKPPQTTSFNKNNCAQSVMDKATASKVPTKEVVSSVKLYLGVVVDGPEIVGAAAEDDGVADTVGVGLRHSA